MGAETPAKAITADNRTSVEYKPTDQPGFYDVKINDTTTTAAVNLDASASDVSFLNRDELATAFKNLPVKTVYPGKDDLTSVVRQTRNGTELWRKLLVGGLLLLIVESFLARRFSRRMAAGKGIGNLSRRDELLGKSGSALAA